MWIACICNWCCGWSGICITHNIVWSTSTATVVVAVAVVIITYVNQIDWYVERAFFPPIGRGPYYKHHRSYLFNLLIHQNNTANERANFTFDTFKMRECHCLCSQNNNRWDAKKECSGHDAIEIWWNKTKQSKEKKKLAKQNNEWMPPKSCKR